MQVEIKVAFKLFASRFLANLVLNEVGVHFLLQHRNEVAEENGKVFLLT